MSNMATVAPSPARRSTVALPIPARSEDSDHNIQSLCRRVASLMYAHRHRLKIHCHWSPEAPPVTIATLPLNLSVAAVELDGVFEAIFVRFQQDRTPPLFMRMRFSVGVTVQRSIYGGRLTAGVMAEVPVKVFVRVRDLAGTSFLPPV